MHTNLPPAARQKGTPAREETKRTSKKQRNALYAGLMALVLMLVMLLTPVKAVPATAQTPSPSGAPAASALQLPIHITEIMTANRSALPDDYGDFPDWIELTNTGSEPFSLKDIGLSDRPTRMSFLFPDMTLAPGAQVIVFASDKAQTDPKGMLHAPFKLSSMGETVYLFDTHGNLLEQVAVPILDNDVSYALTARDWIQTSQYSPGYPNTEEGYQAYRAASVVTDSPLMLNEIITSNRTTLRDEDGDLVDWVELYNKGTVSVSLSGCALSDDETDRFKWRFPKNAVIPAGGYYLVYTSGKNRAPDSGTPHANFSLSEGESVVLSDARGRLIDRTKTPIDLPADQSWGRYTGGGDWSVQLQPTPGLANNRDGINEMDRRMRAANPTGLFISEVMPYSKGVETPFGNTSYDWIEIVNLGSSPINLKDIGLSDNVTRPRKWQFGDVTLEPGEYRLVFASGLGASPTGSSALHSTFRLSAIGSTVTLCDPTGKIFDKVVVPRLPTNYTYGRNEGQTGLYYFDLPTAAAPNVGGFTGYAEMPAIGLVGGVYETEQFVTVTAPPSVQEIRFTTNGAEPTKEDMLYTEPILIPKSAVLRVRGFTDGLQPSDVATTSYFISVYHSLPIISLVTDPQHLWDPENGMYAGDYTQSAKTVPAYDDLTYWKKLPYDGNFEFFDEQGISQVNQGVEMSLHGQYSLDIPQKSFRVSAKARYGKETIDYPFFPDRPYDNYQSLVIRNGGNDGKYTRIVDGLQSRLADKMKLDMFHMAWRPVIVYLNGEYWGHYNIRERINKYSLARYEGWPDPENMDLLKGSGTSSGNVRAGDNENYRELLDYVKNHDLNNPEYLKVVTDWVDIDNYFDWLIMEMYTGNTDAGNMRFYRQRVPGTKWKWVLFDLDWGLFDSNKNGCFIWLDPKGAGDKDFNNELIVALLKVPAMQDRLLQRYGQLYQEFFTDYDALIAMAQEMADIIRPEMPMHMARWSQYNTPRLEIEAPTNPEGNYNYWENRQDRLANVIKKRPSLVWDHVKEWFKLTDAQMIEYFGPKPPMPEGVT